MAAAAVIPKLTVVTIITRMTAGTGPRNICRAAAPVATAAAEVLVRIDQAEAGFRFVVE